MASAAYSEDNNIQEPAAKLFEDNLDWRSVFAFNTETFGAGSLLGRKDATEVVLVRELDAALCKLNPKLGSGELSCIAAAYRIRSIAVMTDEKLARKYAHEKLGLLVETTPRLYGYLHYHLHLSGNDHDEVIKEHERFEKRPLTQFFNETFDEAMRCRLMANMNAGHQS